MLAPGVISGSAKHYGMQQNPAPTAPLPGGFAQEMLREPNLRRCEMNLQHGE